MQTTASEPRLRRLNDALTVVVVLLALYVIFAPFWPQATYWVQEDSPLKSWTSNQESVQDAVDENWAGNRLLLPRLGMNEQIHEGGVEQLKNGVLRQRHTSTPEEGSNTVLVGHRFAYDVRGVFYHLDKVEVGDEIIIKWDGHTYIYEVSDSFVVTPEQVEIEDPTDEEILTLYTCTPLWTAKDRLVVRANLKEVRE